ncbi:Type-5 uracil-DNA glycosylase [Pseudochrobactrum sp. MP213Fo]
MLKPEPSRDCAICPRLHDFLQDWRGQEPSWHNAPVPVFLPTDPQNDPSCSVLTTTLPAYPDRVRLLIIGLAPGLRGANRTGRPFTGDYAGELLYSTLKTYGFAQGSFEARPDDTLTLNDCAIVNAVRCVPPENKPTGPEINNCRQFLTPVITGLPNLQAIVTLGTIAHQSTIRAFGQPVAKHKFGHNVQTEIGSVRIFSSYHCSRYNTNTGVLTEAMFHDVFNSVRSYLNSAK